MDQNTNEFNEMFGHLCGWRVTSRLLCHAL